MLRFIILNNVATKVLIRVSAPGESEFEWKGGEAVDPADSSLRLMDSSEVVQARVRDGDGEWHEFHLNNDLGDAIRKAAASKGFITGV